MSSTCCTTRPAEPRPCPHCSSTGPVVGVLPVRPHRPHARDGAWQHCQNADCHVVFYLDADVIDDTHVVAQVGHKATEQPTPVCFCFAHTATALADDAARHNGVSTIKAEIKAAVTAGQCACEHLNPSTRCCLAAVHRTLTAIAAATV